VQGAASKSLPVTAAPTWRTGFVLAGFQPHALVTISLDGQVLKTFELPE
jgi:hypothetical protein